MKHSTIAKIAHVQLEKDNRLHAEAEIVLPDKFEHVDAEARTHRLSISGEGNQPVEVVQSIMARAFERGEMPA